MNKETLDKMMIAIDKALEEMDAPIEDKLELLINLNTFLHYKEYEENIVTLQRRKNEESSRSVRNYRIDNSNNQDGILDERSRKNVKRD